MLAVLVLEGLDADAGLAVPLSADPAWNSGCWFSPAMNGAPFSVLRSPLTSVAQKPPESGHTLSSPRCLLRWSWCRNR